jgi:hypothetical protein
VKEASRVIFPAVYKPDVRLLAVYAYAHNWYAAPEQFGPDFTRNDLPPFPFIALISNTTAQRVISGFLLSFVVTEIDWKSYENPTL